MTVGSTRRYPTPGSVTRWAGWGTAAPAIAHRLQPLPEVTTVIVPFTAPLDRLRPPT